MNLTAYNNERFITEVFDVSAWAAAYNLSLVTWRFQIRPTAANPLVALDIPNVIGSVNYAANSVQFVAPLSAVRLFAGTVDFDFGFTPPGGDFIRLDGGKCTFVQGVTR